MFEAIENILTLQIYVFSSLAVIAIYFYFHASYSYWKKRNVPTLKTLPPFGNFARSFLTFSNPRLQVIELYKRLDGKRYGGLYSLDRPLLLLRDPELIKVLLVKDFAHFHSRGIEINEKAEPLQGHLFALSGSKWRKLRMKLTPTFTSGKMKIMFPTIVETGKELETCLKIPAANKDVIEFKDILVRYSTDVIASCAFGIQCNCLKDPNAEFRSLGNKLFEVSRKVRLIRTISLFIPSIPKMFNINIFPPDASKYFSKIVKDTVKYREENSVHRNDFLQLMIQLKNETLDQMKDDPLLKIQNDEFSEWKHSTPFEVTIDVIAAQAFVFFLGGFESSSTTTTFCLYELALNPDIQTKLCSEIDYELSKHDGKITYEAIHEMEFMDKVIKETLRKYPPIIGLTRQCTKTTKLADTDLIIEKGIQVQVPILALHHDPKFFPNPDKFDPERFSDQEKNKRPQFCYLPFGEGPRICIGMRFGQIQIKVALTSILSKYKVEVSERTPIPSIFDKKSFVLTCKGGMWLKIINRNDSN